MRVFDSGIKNSAYLLYRLMSPVFDPVKFLTGIYGYFWYLRDFVLYKLQKPGVKLLSYNLFPVLNEKVSFTPFDPHYFFQQIWAFENIMLKKPTAHVDVGSTYQFSGYLSKIVKAVFVDLRPIETSLKNLSIKKGDILDLPFADGEVESLSCLSVAEHIGLGRYGDRLDPEGTVKACRELARILSDSGRLYFSLPVGKERTCFNAHRIYTPLTVLEYFRGLTLMQFSVVDDAGVFHENVNPAEFCGLNYGCGMFLFGKRGK